MRYQPRQTSLLALLILIIGVTCGQNTYVSVRFEPTVPLAGVTRLDLQMELQGRIDSTSAAPGGEISLPTSLVIEIGRGEGTLTITAVARGQDGSEVGRGSGSTQVTAGRTAALTIKLGLPPAPVLVADQMSLDLGSVVVGATASLPTASVKLTNTGTAPSGPLTTSLGAAKDFALATDTCVGAALPVQGSCTITVRFQPGMPGVAAAKLAAGASPGGSVEIALSGTGVAGPSLTLSPVLRNLGSIVEKQSSSEFIFTARNDGAVPTSPLMVTLSGGNAQDFTLFGDDCTNRRLDAKVTCEMKIKFTPSSAGPKTAQLGVSAVMGGSVSAVLNGTGLTVPGLKIDPNSKDFGTKDINNASSAVTFTVTNTGGSETGDLTSQVSAMSPFTIVLNNCVGKLAPAGTCTIQVQFKPTSWGAKNATLSVSGNPGGEVPASLGGIGRDAVPLTIAVTGNGTVTAPAGVSGQGITCPVACTEAYYRTTAPPAVQLAATTGAGSFFAGWSGGGCSGNSAICAVGLDMATTVTATFKTDAKLEISPAASNLAQVATGSTAEAVFQVRNTGERAAVGLTATLSGAEFAITNGCPSALPAGGTCTVKVQFQPMTEGMKSATLTVSGSPGGMASATVSGTGIRYLWSKRFGGALNDMSNAVAVDGSGNVFVVGYFYGTVDFGGGPLTSAGSIDIFVAKYDANGNHKWSKRFGGIDYDQGLAVAVDGSGNVVVAGYFSATVDFGGGALSSAANEDIFVAKYDANGNHRWSRRFGGSGLDEGLSVAVDGSGNVLVAGYFSGTVDFGGGALTSAGDRDAFVAKYDANGNHSWSRRFGGIAPDEAHAVAADGTGNVVVVGHFFGTVDFGGGALTSAGNSDLFVAKYDANGNHKWSKRFGGIDDEYARAVAVDGIGNVVISGPFLGTADFGGGPLASVGSYDIFVAKYDANGNHKWSRRFGGSGLDEGLSVAVDGSGNVIVGGKFAATVDFGGGALTSAGSYDIFVAKYDANGNHKWSKRFGGTGEDRANAVAVDGSGNALVGGEFENTVDFGGGPFISAGSYDAFLLKLAP